MKVKKIAASLFALGAVASPLAYATNGMLMEGYGPISTAMGGASMAYDNGSAAMANNPATIGLMADGTSRFDLAVGVLQPSVSTTCTAGPCAGATAQSGGTAYYMPAGGWVKRNGAMSYGVGVFAIGGMGTEYTSSDWVSAGAGPSRSEVGVGSLLVPISYSVTPDLNIGGSLDFVWSGLDLQMAMSSAQLGGLASSGNLTATGSSPLIGGLPTFLSGPNNVGYFDFSNSSKFTGKASSTGYAGKLGVTYRVNSQLTVGATYHSQTQLGDMTADGAKVSFIDNDGTIGAAGTRYTLTGKVTVVDFQFPEVYGVGLAYQASDSLMVVADYKRIGWAKVMKNFHMTFSSSDMGGINMDMKLPQNWKDQDVINLGLAYKANDALTLRAGTNHSTNPIPNDTVNPLFPATIEDHYMLGMGYAFSKSSDFNASFTYAPKVTVNSPNGYSVSHSQSNWQFMYSYLY